MTDILDLQPARPLADIADFSTFNQRILLAAQGIFSIDRTDHRAQREAEAAEQERLDVAYGLINLDRRIAYSRIAARLEATQFNGVWARSTGAYGAAVAALDRLVTVRASKV